MLCLNSKTQASAIALEVPDQHFEMDDRRMSLRRTCDVPMAALGCPIEGDVAG